MNTWLPYSIMLLLAYIGIVMLMRPYAASAGITHIVKIVRNVEKQISANSELEDIGAKEFHDSLINIAGAYTCISSGVARVAKHRKSSTDHSNENSPTITFAQTHAWTWSYISAISMRLIICEYMRKPWNPKLLARAIIASVLLRFFTRNDGGLSLSFTEQDLVKRYEKNVVNYKYNSSYMPGATA
jgi:hypothetical protein